MTPTLAHIASARAVQENVTVVSGGGRDAEDGAENVSDDPVNGRPEAEGARSAADQASSDADMELSKRDQALSDADQDYSGRDMAGAVSDEHASDADQAAADRLHDVQPGMTDDEEARYIRSRDERQATGKREHTSQVRDAQFRQAEFEMATLNRDKRHEPRRGE